MELYMTLSKRGDEIVGMIVLRVEIDLSVERLLVTRINKVLGHEVG
jgi:hypothetical protein